MPAEKIQVLDPKRWLLGETPGWFLLEVAARAVLIYLLLHVVLRMMGRRVASQLSVSELAVVVTLGAAVGVPMQAPDRGMLAAVVILVIALGFQRGMSWLAYKRRRVEEVTQGKVVTLIEDGRILLPELEHTVLSRERLFAALRGKGIEHLGQLRRVYLETSGDFSLLFFRTSRPGLSVLPEYDRKLHRSELETTDQRVCRSCGALRGEDSTPEAPCEHCHFTEWIDAVVEIDRANDAREEQAAGAPK